MNTLRHTPDTYPEPVSNGGRGKEQAASLNTVAVTSYLTQEEKPIFVVNALSIYAHLPPARLVVLVPLLLTLLAACGSSSGGGLAY
jgi:hypothetical protein